MGSHDVLWYLVVLSCRSLGLACLTWLALWVFRVRSASVKHAAWAVVAAVMLAQVFVSPGLPSVPLRVLAPVPDTAPTPRIIAEKFPVDVLYAHATTRRVLSWKQAVTGFYTAVAAILFARLILGYIFTRRLVRSSRPTEKVRVRESEKISVPMTIGQFRPTILLPAGWREWDSAKLQAVLAHEEAHIRRADWAIGVMARVNCCIFWFHPLAWWLKRRLGWLAEQACDDDALTRLGDRQEYARVLLEIASAMKSAQGRFLGDAICMAKETNVEKRMEQILDETRQLPAAFGRRGWAALLMCSLPVGYFVSAIQLAPAQTKTAIPVAEPISSPDPVPQPKQIMPVQIAQARRDAPQQIPTQTAPDPVPAPAPAPDRAAYRIWLAEHLESPYQRWLDEDAVYIISDDERRAFSRLRNDDEREAFIEQFWLRRDPTPNTAENEMKEEHYRRIAWANDNYSVGVPGWKTDRGMIYIRYGPPDAIDSHGATASTYPYEIWHYPDVTGFGNPVEFEFVDPTMTGRYHLTHDPTEKQRQ
jgi:GWxTD domain-containing protein